MRILNYLMAGLFGVCVAIQYNDPDPIRWMLIYGAAAGACLQAWRWPKDWLVAAAVGLAALSWAVWLSPEVVRQAELGDLFRSMDTKGGAELARELGGLTIVVAWMGVLAKVLRTRRARKDSKIG